ncbi:MAG TPA: flagellar motor switch protein FliM [Terriglobales bacterium]|nr:flagellar motor switch protein FliM [Terriglobales bacterium]
MPEVLSQSQIDELLDALRSEDAAKAKAEAEAAKSAKRVKNYDFRTPKKLTKEQTKTLLGIHENFARHLASYFSGVLRTYCEISVSSIEELPYYEYNNALSDSIMIGVFDIKPIEGAVLFDLTNGVTFALVDRLLGGAGSVYSEEHEFTEIEMALMSKVFRQMSVFFKEAWSNLIETDPVFQQVETNARLLQAVPMEEVVIIVMMDVAIGTVKGTLGISIPCINLERIIEQVAKNKLAPKRQADASQEEELREDMLRRIRNSQLEIHAVLGTTQLTIGDIVNLQVGDVIRVGQHARQDIRLAVGEKIWFTGSMGMNRNRKAVKVREIL